MPIRPSSVVVVVVNFSLKIFVITLYYICVVNKILSFLRNCLITFFLRWHGSLLGRYQCTAKNVDLV